MEKKVDALMGLVDELQKKHDERLVALEKKSDDPLLKEQIEKINQEITKTQEEVKAAQKAAARNVTRGPEKDVDEKAAAYSAAWKKFAMSGSEVELKALSVDSDPDGGYTVPEQMSTEIIKKVFESNPMRQLASVQTISTESFDIMVDYDEASAGWVGETQARTETDTPELAKINIPVHEIYAEPKATQKLLDDSAINIEQWLAEHVSMKFARMEESAFIAGNGVLKPKGILEYADGSSYDEIEQIAGGHASQLEDDALVKLVYGLKAFYKQNASFLMKRATVEKVRLLKDSDGQYGWQPGLQSGEPDMLMNYPIYEADDMPAVAADALPIAFGDFRAGYQIVDRIGIRTLRDNLTLKGWVKFYTTKRVGGGVKNGEAMKLLKISV